MRLIIESVDGPLSGEHQEGSDLDRAHHLVDEFLVFVRSNDVGSDIIDEIELPVPKPLLVQAFSIVIAAERRPEVKSLLMKAGITLAQYRPGLGPRVRVRPGSSRWRPERAISKQLANRLEQTLRAVAEERIGLAEVYLRAISRSFN